MNCKLAKLMLWHVLNRLVLHRCFLAGHMLRLRSTCNIMGQEISSAKVTVPGFLISVMMVLGGLPKSAL